MIDISELCQPKENRAAWDEFEKQTLLQIDHPQEFAKAKRYAQLDAAVLVYRIQCELGECALTYLEDHIATLLEAKKLLLELYGENTVMRPAAQYRSATLPFAGLNESSTKVNAFDSWATAARIAPDRTLNRIQSMCRALLRQPQDSELTAKDTKELHAILDDSYACMNVLCSAPEIEVINLLLLPDVCSVAEALAKLRRAEEVISTSKLSKPFEYLKPKSRRGRRKAKSKIRQKSVFHLSQISEEDEEFLESNAEAAALFGLAGDWLTYATDCYDFARSACPPAFSREHFTYLKEQIAATNAILRTLNSQTSIRKGNTFPGWSHAYKLCIQSITALLTTAKENESKMLSSIATKYLALYKTRHPELFEGAQQ